MSEPTRAEIDRTSGPVVLEFGAEWCGFCQALRPHLDGLLEQHPEVRHLRIEDGPGRPLGRSFRVKLWPTLVFLRDGQVEQIAVRPGPDEVATGLRTITGSDPEASASAPGAT